MSNDGGTGVTDHMSSAIPARRLGTPEDVAALCAYLASEKASWMTAQTIPLAGAVPLPAETHRLASGRPGELHRVVCGYQDSGPRGTAFGRRLRHV